MTTIVRPATVMKPKRGNSQLLRGGTETIRVPEPTPVDPDGNVIHTTVLVAVHSHPGDAVTDIVAVSLLLTISCDGEIFCVHTAPPPLAPAMRLTAPFSATT